MQNNLSFFPVKKNILGVEVSDALEYEILESVVDFIEKTKKNAYIVTPNPEMVVAAAKNHVFKKALNGADLALCDGFGLYVAGRILGRPLSSRIIGTNFVENLCEKVANQPIRVGFLGGKQGVAMKAAERLRKKYPGLLVSFAGEEWGTIPSGVVENSKLKIENSLDILFVALGHPKQELWMAEHLGKIPVRVMVGVGGAFDQIVDSSLRPPLYISSIGMGWLYRLVRQPWRFKRQLALVQFLGMLLHARFFSH